MADLLRAYRELMTERHPDLGPGTPNRAVLVQLQDFAHSYFTSYPALVSALWLYHDYLDESHEISQGLHTPTGSLLHAIMHRREPDAWNSKYWFRKVGTHPIHAPLAAFAQSLGYSTSTRWDAASFVDAVEAARGTATEQEHTLKLIQAEELRLLCEHCAQPNASHHAR